MYCPKCGTQNPEKAKVCRSCGQPLPVLPDIPQTSVRTSALAIWSFVLALIGLFTFMLTTLPALICGIVSLVKISKSQGQLKGTGLAVTGIALSSIGTIILPLLIMMLAILMPALGKVRSLAQTTMCSTNLSCLRRAVIVYARDHNDMYPPADSWCDVLIKNCDVSPKQFCCPASDAKVGKSSYAINVNVAGRKTSEVPPDTVLLFETKPGVNPAGGPEILNTDNHQRDGCNVLFADGHVEFIKSEKLSTLHWTSE
jgi:prepilin-type processing-associated H-X9-DG protein